MQINWAELMLWIFIAAGSAGAVSALIHSALEEWNYRANIKTKRKGADNE